MCEYVLAHYRCFFCHFCSFSTFTGGLKGGGQRILESVHCCVAPLDFLVSIPWNTAACNRDFTIIETQSHNAPPQFPYLLWIIFLPPFFRCWMTDWSPQIAWMSVLEAMLLDCPFQRVFSRFCSRAWNDPLNKILWENIVYWWYYITLRSFHLQCTAALAHTCTFSVKPSIGETLLLPFTESEELSAGKELSTEVVAVAISRALTRLQINPLHPCPPSFLRARKGKSGSARTMVSVSIIVVAEHTEDNNC